MPPPIKSWGNCKRIKRVLRHQLHCDGEYIKSEKHTPMSKSEASSILATWASVNLGINSNAFMLSAKWVAFRPPRMGNVWGSFLMTYAIQTRFSRYTMPQRTSPRCSNNTDLLCWRVAPSSLATPSIAAKTFLIVSAFLAVRGKICCRPLPASCWSAVLVSPAIMTDQGASAIPKARVIGRISLVSRRLRTLWKSHKPNELTVRTLVLQDSIFLDKWQMATTHSLVHKYLLQILPTQAYQMHRDIRPFRTLLSDLEIA